VCARRFELSSDRRPGVTLLEVLLTLCLLVVIAALTWPMLTGPLDNQRLRHAAEQLRARWCEIRVDAMSSGRTHVFYYVAESNHYYVEKLPDDLALSTGEGQSYSPTAQFDVPQEISEDELPEGVTFAAVEAADDSLFSSAEVPEQLRYIETEQPLGDDQSWSWPIVFYPGGTTSTARVMLKNDKGRFVELRLRGLTGVVEVGRLRKSKEPQP